MAKRIDKELVAKLVREYDPVKHGSAQMYAIANGTSYSSFYRARKTLGNKPKAKFVEFAPTSQVKIDLTYNGITFSVPLNNLKAVLEVLK
jgi:predicted NAD/FAD-binding protein